MNGSPGTCSFWFLLLEATFLSLKTFTEPSLTQTLKALAMEFWSYGQMSQLDIEKISMPSGCP
jgi:hypothetical protein